MSLLSIDPSKHYSPSGSFMRIASISPQVQLADISVNASRIKEHFLTAADNGASLAVFPELSLTGYTLGDLVQNTALLNASGEGLFALAEATACVNAAMIIGLPLRIWDGLYNCAALLSGGQVRGIVPKTHLPTYGEFYENRWFESYTGPVKNIRLRANSNIEIPFGQGLLFDVAGVLTGIEICEDLWVPDPPSVALAKNGALIIANPSASPEQIGKDDYRRNMVRVHSGRLLCGYVYCGCSSSESTAEIVMGGHSLIASNYRLEAEKEPFSKKEMILADVDIDHLEYDRSRQHFKGARDFPVIDCGVVRTQNDLLVQPEKNMFLPSEDAAARAKRLQKAFSIQSAGLAERMKSTKSKRIVLGLSGGLDSTLALLVAIQASEILGRDRKEMITAITMPGPASSDMTQSNAVQLASLLGVSSEVIPIGELAALEMAALRHDVINDITYENIQARARTSILFNYGNKHNCIVLGTGDLSELALGWCTYNGDQQSHYNVNASLPKTYIRAMIAFLKDTDEFLAAKEILESILATPITPELTKDGGEGITQNTEDIVGPYELHDFFLFHLVRFADTPEKIAYLAGKAFQGCYDSDKIHMWLEVFLHRFRISQFKRDTMPNGPKVGAVSLSPRGDWRMPSDLP